MSSTRTPQMLPMINRRLGVKGGSGFKEHFEGTLISPMPLAK